MNTKARPIHFLTAVLCASTCLAISPGEEEFLKLSGHEKDGMVIPLWPGAQTSPLLSQKTQPEEAEIKAPKSPRITHVDKPSMIIVPPPAGVARTGTTILFAPGGAYRFLSLPNAVDICNWAGAIGAHCVVLQYCVPNKVDDPEHLMPLSDAQRAVRLLRAKASELGIDPNKIIMVGSSAGGHLALNLANNHSQQLYPAVDQTDGLSPKPNAVVLMYPAYLTQPRGSLTANPGLHVDQLGIDRTPPVFMAVTQPDENVWGVSSMMLQLRQAKIPAELHVYPEGGHGGCFNKYPLMEFVRPAASFLKSQGLFTATMQQASDRWLDDLEATIVNRAIATGMNEKQPALMSSLTREDWTLADQRLVSLGESRDRPPLVIQLWPGEGTRDDDPAQDLVESLPEKDDGLLRITNVSRPTLHLWQPSAPDGRAVIIFPGGGYNGLAAQHEGSDLAVWLNQQGITAFILKYRVPRREGMEKHAVALQDAQRAIRTIRSRAAEFGVLSDQIGVLGFSAGGNLAALTVHQAHSLGYQAIDEIDQVAARPDFVVFVYPAYLVSNEQNTALDPLLAALPVRNDYPPIFTAVAADDRFAPDSILYNLQLHKQKVPGELHVYASGGHGKGMRETGGPFAQWTRDCERWLADLKFKTTNIVRQR